MAKGSSSNRKEMITAEILKHQKEKIMEKAEIWGHTEYEFINIWLKQKL